MKIIILEGIATSGKTTIKNNLVKAFIEKGVSFFRCRRRSNSHAYYR